MVILCFLLVGFEEGTRCGGASWGAKIILFRAVVKGVRGDASQYMDNTAGGDCTRRCLVVRDTSAFVA